MITTTPLPAASTPPSTTNSPNNASVHHSPITMHNLSAVSSAQDSPPADRLQLSPITLSPIQAPIKLKVVPHVQTPNHASNDQRPTNLSGSVSSPDIISPTQNSTKPTKHSHNGKVKKQTKCKRNCKKGKQTTLVECIGDKCKHKQQSAGDMIQCSNCNEWFHDVCINEDLSRTTIFTCPSRQHNSSSGTQLQINPGTSYRMYLCN